mmetsp:Transcript_37684/g.113860  ORF Transcript_37684/g.113860 Transcript_37684/m.113860 type:complete len:207 (+) Transcript_37684:377-997(+)
MLTSYSARSRVRSTASQAYMPADSVNAIRFSRLTLKRTLWPPGWFRIPPARSSAASSARSARSRCARFRLVAMLACSDKAFAAGRKSLFNSILSITASGMTSMGSKAVHMHPLPCSMLPAPTWQHPRRGATRRPSAGEAGQATHMAVVRGSPRRIRVRKYPSARSPLTHVPLMSVSHTKRRASSGNGSKSPSTWYAPGHPLDTNVP